MAVMLDAGGSNFVADDYKRLLEMHQGQRTATPGEILAEHARVSLYIDSGAAFMSSVLPVQDQATLTGSAARELIQPILDNAANIILEKAYTYSRRVHRNDHVVTEFIVTPEGAEASNTLQVSQVGQEYRVTYVKGATSSGLSPYQTDVAAARLKDSRIIAEITGAEAKEIFQLTEAARSEAKNKLKQDIEATVAAFLKDPEKAVAIFFVEKARHDLFSMTPQERGDWATYTRNVGQKVICFSEQTTPTGEKQYQLNIRQNTCPVTPSLGSDLEVTIKDPQLADTFKAFLQKSATLQERIHALEKTLQQERRDAAERSTPAPQAVSEMPDAPQTAKQSLYQKLRTWVGI